MEPVAVLDIGSNSARVVVFDRDAAGTFRIRAGTRAALRLVRDVDRRHELSEETMARVMEALRDFRAIALGAGAKRIVAVATAAMRDAENGDQLIKRIRRELGIKVEIIDGDKEARYGFLGAVRGLPVHSGLLFDLGGGSMQLTRFQRRRLGRDWSLPLGALRLSQAFLEQDPPKAGELRRLREHVHEVLRDAHVPSLKRGETLIGTGGTVRNLAKVDRRTRGYPVTRLHGYVLTASRLREVVDRLVSLPLRKRESLPGLSDERADSIVGGALAIVTLLDRMKAEAVLVSGEGVREGVAWSLISGEMPDPQQVRTLALQSLAARFEGAYHAAGPRRAQVAAALREGLDPRAGDEMAEALEHACRVLDIGRSVDFFDRHEHAAEIVLATELDGFSHRQIALLAGVLRRAGDPKADPRRLSPLVKNEDADGLARAAVLLSLADDIEERCPRGKAVQVRCEVGKRQATVRVRGLLGWRPRQLGERFEQTFGRELLVVAEGRRSR
jgi:exopolyphosphatase / guanosine-5'-triphosphate,3'-diphosphate pyrophosphatase